MALSKSNSPWLALMLDSFIALAGRVIETIYHGRHLAFFCVLISYAELL